MDTGATVVVTGASRGIGAAVARRLADDESGPGAHVVACARQASALASLSAARPDAVTAVRADVRDEFDVERLMETAARAGPAGGIDAVVANAAVFHAAPGEAPVDDESYDAFDDTFRTNVRGTFAAVREALPHMGEDGRVLVPSGSVAREATPGMGAYAPSKAAAEALARQFAVDVPPAVGVLDPGLVATDLTGGGRGRDPEDVAPMFEWALTDLDAEALNGEVIDLRAWREATR